MKRLFKLAIAAATCLVSANTFAQNAREIRTKVGKVEQNAVIADFDAPKDVVDGALVERLDKANIGKKKSEKGFYVYKGVVWPEISSNKVDIYAKTDGNKSKASVYLLVSTGYDNFVSSTSDAATTENMKNVLNSFMSDLNNYKLKLAFSEQEKVVKKAQDAVASANDNNKKLISEKEKIEKQIAESNAGIENAQKALSAEQSKLNDIKSQIR